ncbi:MAG: bacteriohemerythrin [Xanthomonadales bacterium]|jgi:hemerythrin-like metal-binding protein/PAS domain S-box-containing protein|nr:bacteriohemerythrin [Xanthomonadales bacterium]
MFELFPWNPMLETEIGIIDAQHQQLVELLNRLARMYVGDADPAAVDAVLEALTAYAQEHFRTEETIWAALPAAAPLRIQHEDEHAGFCRRVRAARETSAAGTDSRLTRELLLFLSGWLAEHILQSDRRMARVLRAQARGRSLTEAMADAQAELSGDTGLMVQAALDMYRRLSAQTLELLQEREQREATARAMATLQIERERQALAVSLAGMLLASSAGSLQADLETLVRRVAETLGAHRCLVRLFSADRQQVDCRAEWCMPGVVAMRDLLGVLHVGGPLDAWSARLGAHGEARIDDTRDLPEWADPLRPLLETAGGGSMFAVSLRHRDAFLGWLAVHMVGEPRRWSDDEVQWLRLLGSMLGSALLRHGAEQQLRLLVDAMPVGLSAASIRTRRLLFCNDASCELLGKRREDLIGMDVADLHPPGELARIEREFAGFSTGKASPVFNMEVCRPDGSRFLAEVRQVMLELDGEPVALGIVTDVTRRVAAETALKASEQLLEQQIRARTGELAEANQRLQRAGQRMRGMLDLSRQLHLLSEQGLLQAGVELAVRLTGSRDGYLHFLTADGHRIQLFAWAATSREACTAQVPGHYPLEQAGIWADAARLRTPLVHNDFPAEPARRGMPQGHIPLQRHLCVPVLDGEVPRMLVGVGNKREPYDAYDVDQLQLIANDLWGLLLRHRAEAALAAARDAAEQHSRAKSAFLANMSHEIRTPLNAVIGFAQVLGRDPSLGARQREQVQIIARSGEHLLQLVNDVLDLSKIESGQLKLTVVNFSPTLLLDEVARLHLLRASERGLRFSVEGLPSLPAQLRGDVIKLRQIVLNLLGNALKFTVQGGVTLRAAAHRATDGCWQLQVEVIDTGPGISAADQARLFTPFQQGSAGEQLGSGTGLGLSISRRLAMLMGGTLDLDSQPGQGSRFRLALPFAEEATEHPDRVDAAGSGEGAHVAPADLDLGVLAPTLRASMREAVRAGDMTRLRALVEGLPDSAADIGARLQGLIQRYDYERLEALLQ